MRLLQKTGRYYWWFSLGIFLLGAIGLFLALRSVIHEETDEGLLKSKALLIEGLGKRAEIASSFTYNILDEWVEVQEISQFTPSESFQDTSFWDPFEKEIEQFRKLIFNEQINGKNYRIAISHPKLESEYMAKSLVGVVIAGLALFLLSLNLFNRYLAERLWSPFYQTVNKIEQFKFADQEELHSPDTGIDEFDTLNQAIEQMTGKIIHDYRTLKQFTENASHEIQTPLAIIKNKIELLMQMEGMNETEIEALQQINGAASRLSKLNHSLLLLTRIENRQYVDVKRLNFRTLIEEKLNQLEPLIESKSLTVTTDYKDAWLLINPTLADVLLNNLLSNAIKHNFQDGKIDITLQEKGLLIRNTGLPLTVPEKQLFGRFKKGTDSTSSTGLGLSIVKEICNTLNWKIDYNYHNNFHQIRIVFHP